MKNKIICLLFISVAFFGGYPGLSAEDAYKPAIPVPSHMEKGFISINSVDSFSYLAFIAADELEGRDTATRGLTIARKYIQSLYETWGIGPAGDWLGEGEEKKVQIQKPYLLISRVLKDLFFFFLSFDVLIQ